MLRFTKMQSSIQYVASISTPPAGKSDKHEPWRHTAGSTPTGRCLRICSQKQNRRPPPPASQKIHMEREVVDCWKDDFVFEIVLIIFPFPAILTDALCTYATDKRPNRTTGRRMRTVLWAVKWNDTCCLNEKTLTFGAVVYFFWSRPIFFTNHLDLFWIPLTPHRPISTPRKRRNRGFVGKFPTYWTCDCVGKVFFYCFKVHLEQKTKGTCLLENNLVFFSQFFCILYGFGVEGWRNRRLYGSSAAEAEAFSWGLWHGEILPYCFALAIDRSSEPSGPHHLRVPSSSLGIPFLPGTFSPFRLSDSPACGVDSTNDWIDFFQTAFLRSFISVS